MKNEKEIQEKINDLRIKIARCMDERWYKEEKWYREELEALQWVLDRDTRESKTKTIEDENEKL